MSHQCLWNGLSGVGNQWNGKEQEVIKTVTHMGRDKVTKQLLKRPTFFPL